MISIILEMKIQITILECKTNNTDNNNNTIWIIIDKDFNRDSLNNKTLISLLQN